MRKLWATLLLCFALAALAHAELAVPPLTARVMDLTGTLSAQEKASLEQTLQALEAEKGSQIAVLIVSTTQPEVIEQYSLRVAEQWKLGRKGVDDGALLLVAKDDRKMRIEVGYGLEGALNDATAKRIIAEIITPYFKNGDFFTGIQAGVQAMVKVVEGEPLPVPKPKPKSESTGTSFGQWLPLAFILGFFVAPLLRRGIGRFPASLAAGALTTGFIWFLAGSLVIAIIIGILTLLFSLFSGIGSGLGGAGRGGYYGGGLGGGGDGGFSGGGGGFGGGGASGDW